MEEKTRINFSLSKNARNILKATKRLGFSQTEAVETGLMLWAKELNRILDKVGSKEARMKLANITSMTSRYKGKTDEHGNYIP
jgi:hypothetical protein